MAYTNGIFYIDLVNGNDATRTALTTCIASNPSGTITRINKTAHGLVTGAVVDLTLFSSWLNGVWKITKVDDDNFDLDTAVWQTTVINTGTVTPRGGSSWTDAWKTMTITTGATAARIQSGDEIRVAKSNDPVSIGNATWTNKSKTVTLSTPQTVIIDNCETTWTSANSATVAISSTRKQGNNSVRVIRSSSVTTNTLYAYRSLGSVVDFSSYNSITLWISAYNSSAILPNNWKLALCSDTAGAVIVDEFPLPGSNTSTSAWYCAVIQKSGGGNLGSSIQSIALYSSTVQPSVFCGVGLDNINACNYNGLNLTSLISKKTHMPFDSNEGLWGIQSIVGATLLLDAGTSALPTSGLGYVGSTETVTTYMRNPIIQGPRLDGTATNVLNKDGLTASGGWNTSSGIKDSITVLDGSNGVGAGMKVTNLSKISEFYFCRFVRGADLFSTDAQTVINCGFSNNNEAIQFGTDSYHLKNFLISSSILNSNNLSFDSDTSSGEISNVVFDDCKIFSNTTSMVNYPIAIDSLFYSCSFLNNNSIYFKKNVNKYNAINSIFENSVAASGQEIFFKNCLFTNATEFLTTTAGHNIRINSQKHDQTDQSYIFTDGGTINSQVKDRPGQTGNMWRLALTNTTRTSSYPLDLEIGQFAVAANSLVTVKAWMKKSHATNCDGRLRVRGYQLAGVDNDVVATLANNTNWQELTLTFTPTEAGVFEVEALAEYVAGNANVFIDTITVTQA
jgi:hypothetical protein